MKRISILIGMLLLISSLGFSVNPTDPELLKIPSLKTLAEKVDVKTQKVKDAAASSRSANQEAQTELTAAYTEYAVELNKQKELSNDNVLKTAIDKELKLVNEKLGIATSTKSK
ncbi:MAG: hypothetical protein K0S33_492 [Bacteroidetes bacterium]|jgi:hypothetical protein|nr:hypothetical protein [Bacteroidota bacterium]